MKARVAWKEARTFVGTTEGGQQLAFGSAYEDTQKPGPTPMELILLGVGGCSAYDVVSILEKGRQQVDDVSIELEADRAETEPKVFTRIHLHYIVTGHAIDPARVARAISLSIDKYCSASAMVAKTATLSHDFEIRESAVF